MTVNLRYLFIMLTAICTVCSSCRKRGCTDVKANNYEDKAKVDDGSCEYDFVNGFEPSTMLNNIGNNIILPRYLAFRNATSDLMDAISIFINNNTESNLSTAQLKLHDAEVAWQGCAAFEFGPAEENSLRTNVNTFPTDTGSIEGGINSGTYDLTSFLAVGYKGLPALDYLLNSGENGAILSSYLSSPERETYLSDVAAELDSDANEVYNAWLATDGNYIQTFTISEGSDVSSSLSLLVNQFNYDYELVKNAKIGIPLGKQTLGDPLPEQVEAYYGQISAELAKEALGQLYNLYLGINEHGTDEEGFDDYIIGKGNNALSADIKAQFDLIITKMNQVPDPMSETIVNDPDLVDQAYEEIKKLVVLIKTDMSAEMEVAITYSDGDGD